MVVNTKLDVITGVTGINYGCVGPFSSRESLWSFEGRFGLEPLSSQVPSREMAGLTHLKLSFAGGGDAQVFRVLGEAEALFPGGA